MYFCNVIIKQVDNMAMKHYRMITLVMAMMLAMTAIAQQSMTITDNTREQKITVTAVGEDIVRVDAVPDSWKGV